METIMTKKSEATSDTGVKKVVSVSPITLDKVAISGEFQKPGTLTAQIRQMVETKSYYPSKKTTSDKQANIFSNDDFGFGTQDFTSTENRVAFLLVPTNATEEVVKAKLAAAMAAGACIYRVLSNSPILDENQKYAIAAGLRTKDMFANSQVVRYPKTKENDEKGLSGKIWVDRQGKVQYRKTFFWNTPQADQDLRNGGSDYYTTPEIQAELQGASVLTGQTIVL